MLSSLALASITWCMRLQRALSASTRLDNSTRPLPRISAAIASAVVVTSSANAGWRFQRRSWRAVMPTFAAICSSLSEFTQQPSVLMEHAGIAITEKLHKPG
jgi:hypothetical protein